MYKLKSKKKNDFIYIYICRKFSLEFKLDEINCNHIFAQH